MKFLFTRNKIPAAFCLLPLMLIFFSCESLPLNYSRSQAWPVQKKAHNGGRAGGKHIKGTVRIIGVTVDRPGGWDTVKREIAGLAPLCFWKQGCPAAGADGEADYTADIRLREREYSYGWRTRRSLAVEVRIWAAGDDPEHSLPAAAARIITVGNRSFSSSDTTGRMLFRAVKKAVKLLAVQKKKG